MSNELLLEDVLKEFIFDCQIRNLSKRTIKSYKNNNMRFFKFIKQEYGIVELEEVNSKHIKLYFKYLKKNSLTESYINSILKKLRAFFKYCSLEEYISFNPCTKVKWQREKKILIQAFEDEEVVRMLNAYDYSGFLEARNKTIIAFLIETGIRNLELCTIQVSDVKEQYIIIHGKGNKDRYVPITLQMKKYMIKYERIKEYYFKDKLSKAENYFLSRTARQLTPEAIENIVKKAGKVANIRDDIRCSPHTFRHYYAQTQLKNGLDVYSLSRVLGHENISITKRYLQSINDKNIIKMPAKTSPLMNIR